MRFECGKLVEIEGIFFFWEEKGIVLLILTESSYKANV